MGTTLDRINSQYGTPTEGMAVPQDVRQPLSFDLDSTFLSASSLLEESGDRARQMMTGEIPEDLRGQITQISTEQSLSQGLGLGGASENKTARDLGLTSLDIVERGMTQAQQVATGQMNLAKLEEGVLEWQEQFALSVDANEQNATQIQMAGAELISRNQQFILGLVNDLVLNNSRTAIEGVQANMNFLTGTQETPGYMVPTNTAIVSLMKKYG